MKILIQSNAGPFALSRRSIAVATSVLPADLVRRVAKLYVVREGGPEPFEYSSGRVVYFCIPGNSRDPHARDRALRELLLGFLRVESGGKFGVPLSDRHRDEFKTFVDEWHPRAYGQS